ncbi:hypothetical protein AAFF_G00302610 [Aldrovandia affinis]|uniref:Uncharacterized protein n=1 Tax=Aldrovandia affinis TaxID=143900 RepID=A0AAD7R8A8_9TELE|nr:hypothetical protein AAFF_G00302610 [Aldrovandia affinis]
MQSYPLSGRSSSSEAAQLQQFSLEENEAEPYSGSAARRCHHHHSAYGSPDTLCSLQTHNVFFPELRSVTPCVCEECDRGLIKQELESTSMPVPWPSLLINIDKAEEKQLTEKSLRSPASPAVLPDHLKCNILKAQMDAAFRVMKEGGVDCRNSSSSQEHNGRFPTSSQDSVSSSLTKERPPVRADRRKRLVRQFSFNHSDEDDLPPALAAISAETASESSLDQQVQPPIYPKADIPMLELEMQCCEHTRSPSKPTAFCQAAVPPLLSCETHKDRAEAAALEQEKLMRRLLMTEL